MHRKNCPIAHKGEKIAHYAKGANAERELVHRLAKAGFSVARVAGSGVSVLNPPDLVALSRQKRLAFESKAWDSTSLSIPKEQFESFLEWCQIADCQAVLAWRRSREGWFFLKPEHFHKTPKAYAISHHDALNHRIDFGVLTGTQTVLAEKKP